MQLLLEQLPIFLLTGAFAGLLSGLFGVGGGLILVPVLAFVLPLQHVPQAVVMQTALGTSLAVIACHSTASAHAHHRHGGVLWRVVAMLAPGLTLGSFAGAYIAHLLSSAALKHIVAVGALLVAVQMALDLRPRTAHRLPGTPGLVAVGGFIGAISALVGIGGGSLTVPFLSWCGVEMRKAAGTSAACGVLIAGAGAVGFALTGLEASVTGPHTIGYVSVPGFVSLMIASVATSGQGARLAHRLPPKTLRRAFSVFLCFVAAALWVA